MSRWPIRELGLVLRGLVVVVLLPLVSLPAAEAAEAAGARRVLIIHSFGRDFAPYNVVGSAFRTELAQLLQGSVVFQETSFDVERGGPLAVDAPFLDFLHSRYGESPPDLIVTIGGPATRFHLQARPRLFPHTPLLATGIERRVSQALSFGSSDHVVSARLDAHRSAQHILELLPDTKVIATVLGASPLEQFWQKELLRDLAPLNDRVQLLPLGGLTLAQLRQQVAALPANAAVLYFGYALGPDGVPQEDDRALAAVSEASNAPVFSVYAEQLGGGTVGGRLFDLRRMGELSAEIGHRMLQGNATADPADLTLEAQAPAFDWRQLQRWGISEARLPAGAEVRFRSPSRWEQYKFHILLGCAVVLLQAGLIASLLLQRVRRQRAEKDAVALSGRLLTAHEDERRRLARELHDDLTQRLARLAIDAGRLEQRDSLDRMALGSMRNELVQLSEDVHALSYRLHPSVLDDLGLVEALRAECDRASRQGALRVAVDASGVPEELPGDTSLCLFRVAQEALSNAVRHACASAVTVLLRPRGKGLQLTVSDNGAGFDSLEERKRASLGLASMRERVRLLQGELDIESTPGRGTTVVAWVPA